MKLDIIRNELLLTGLTDTDISFCNLSGRDTGSVYYNPQRPEHSLRIVVSDPQIIEALSDYGVNLTEKVSDQDGGASSYSFKVKAYPRMSMNRITGVEEQMPRVLLKDPTTESVRLESASFNLIDDALYRKNVIDISIAFHVYEAQPYHRMTAALDELKLVCKSYDELVSASNVSAEYANGYFPDSNEEVPFK